MIRLDLDIAGLKDLLDLPERARAAVQQAAGDLSRMGHARAVELAAERLRQRRRPFVEALRVQQVDENTHLIVLDGSARWVEEGLPARDLLKTLLASAKAKTGKDGKKYMVIPMRHGPAAEEASPIQQESIGAIQAEMKARNIPWAKTEKDESGRPLYGRLHSFDVRDAPVKTGFGPGQGQGAVGAARSGLSNRNAAVNQGFGFEAGKARGGATPHLAGVSVYQRPGPNGSTQRDVVTFRVASEKQLGSGRWQAPDLKGAKIFDAVEQWLSDTWEKDVAPAILRQLIG